MAQITVNPGTTYQRLKHGWMCESNACQTFDIDLLPLNPDFANIQSTVIANAVEVGYTAIAIPAHCGWENPQPYWYNFHVLGTIPRTGPTGYKPNRRTTITANSDPNGTLVVNNGTSYDIQSGELDSIMTGVVIPFRNAVIANNETPHVIMKYEAFTGTDTVNDPEATWISSYIHDDSAFYKRFGWFVLKYIHDTYGFWPDAWEVMIEPDFNNTFYSDYNGAGATLLAAHLKALGDKLAAEGCPTKLIFPSPSNASRVPAYYDDAQNLAGAEQYVDEIGFHRYGASTADVTAVGTLAVSRGKGAIMTEYEVTDPQNSLYDDLTLGMCTSWGLGNPIADLTNVPYVVSHVDYGTIGTYPGNSYPTNLGITLSYQSKLLRIYMKHIRLNAVRYQATSDTGTIKATAWVNEDGTHVCVIEATAGLTFSVAGLPTNTYGIRYALTDGFANPVDLGNQSIATGQNVDVTVPGAAWIEVYGTIPLPPDPTFVALALFRKP